ncbi:MAG: hypothetical protein RLZZ15_3869, partial [Verrucomicrobiota bacterium]
GALFATWLETDGSLWLRRVSPEFAADEPTALAPAGAATTRCYPQLALVRDFAGEKTTAQFAAVYTGAGKTPALHTLLVTVPEGELREAGKTCECETTPELPDGHAIRGAITAVEKDALRVRLDEAPGVFAAGARDFRADASVLAAARAGRKFIGRAERRDGVWWIFDVRLIAGAVEPGETR